MRIAIVGGTGTLGRPLAEVLAAGGHDVRVLSRSAPEWPVDVCTGAGLEAALDGCDVVVDAANGPPSAKAAEVLVDGARRVASAARAAGASDGGGHVAASRRLHRGASKVARGMLALARRPPRGGYVADVNGAPGIVMRGADGVLSVLAFTVDQGRITTIDVIRNPDKLRHVRTPEEVEP